jgi:DNA-binding MarR family transcriptional regulator
MARKRSDRPVPNELDPLIHERLRLGILSALAVEESISFTGLRDLLATTDGNLSVQARRLEEAGYVSCEKTFEGRKPRSTYRLAPRGRKALEEYLEVLSGLLPDIARGRRARAPRPGTDPLPTHG